MARSISPLAVRDHWRRGAEIAVLDVREEGAYARAHPFFAVSLPLSRLELEILARVPRRSAPVVVFDNGEGLAERAAVRLADLGYTQVFVLDGGLDAYAAVGEVFRDVNVPSKAFGELVEAIRHTPSLTADAAARLITEDANVIIVDSRRFEEYRTMSIPGAISVPGGELVRRIDDLLPGAETTVIVNCAGRTRSIIGAQSLVNAGPPNRVLALRNGTIGWTLAGYGLDRGRTARYAEQSSAASLTMARARAVAWADKVGVRRIDRNVLQAWKDEADLRTLHLLDVRAPEDYARGHPADFISAPGGQLVQALDEWVAVRGARLVLFDDDGIRAPMAASWLVQMGWEAVTIGIDDLALGEAGRPAPPRPPLPSVGEHGIDPADVARLRSSTTILDLAPSPTYEAGHIPGAGFVIRSQLQQVIAGLPPDRDIILTSPDGDLAAYAVPEAKSGARRVHFLLGGSAAWTEAGYQVTADNALWLSAPDDVYKRPYEGTDNAAEAMQAYIDWELRLVAQLANDGVCNFRVI